MKKIIFIIFLLLPITSLSQCYSDSVNNNGVISYYSNAIQGVTLSKSISTKTEYYIYIEIHNDNKIKQSTNITLYLDNNIKL